MVLTAKLCTLCRRRHNVHKHRNLLAHAPQRLREEIAADYNDLIYAETSQQIGARRKAFIRKWRIKHRAVADGLEEAGARLFSFTRLPACAKSTDGKQSPKSLSLRQLIAA
jgi:transposase-like protein